MGKKRSYCLMVTEFWEDEKVLKTDSVDGFTTLKR